ncbi:MAG: DUF2797 domain-containing protein [Methylococcaceae bacterium]|jgi:hypothetical protein
MKGQLRKMQVSLENPVHYQLPLTDERVPLNPVLGQNIRLNFTGKIFCSHCGRATKKSFDQGYCYPCFTSLAQCDMCIVKPELCHYDAGTCREPEWGLAFCYQPHIVYLANSSGVKVGITRQSQIPTRWIDQGASQALPIFKVQSRQISGLIEVELAKHVSDKTSWQQMLKSRAEPVDLAAKRDELMALCEPKLTELKQRFGESAITFLPEQAVTTINFPIATYPTKVTSFNLDKAPQVAGVLQGIKGQYLILDNGVINIRKYAGYEVEFEIIA